MMLDERGTKATRRGAHRGRDADGGAGRGRRSARRGGAQRERATGAAPGGGGGTRTERPSVRRRPAERVKRALGRQGSRRNAGRTQAGQALAHGRARRRGAERGRGGATHCTVRGERKTRARRPAARRAQNAGNTARRSAGAERGGGGDSLRGGGRQARGRDNPLRGARRRTQNAGRTARCAKAARGTRRASPGDGKADTTRDARRRGNPLHAGRRGAGANRQNSLRKAVAPPLRVGRARRRDGDRARATGFFGSAENSFRFLIKRGTLD